MHLEYEVFFSFIKLISKIFKFFINIFFTFLYCDNLSILSLDVISKYSTSSLFIFNESLNVFDRKSKKQELVKRALVKNFIEEQGVDNLLRSFRKQNVLLSEFAFITDKAVKSVSETSNLYNKNYDKVYKI